MASPYVNAGSVSSAASVTSRAPGLPASRVTGNILVAVCSSGNNATHTWSGTGWSKIGSNINSGASFTSSIGWCVINGSEGSPTISWTGAAGAVAIVWQLSGVAITQSFPSHNTNSGSTSTHSATGFTGSTTGSLAIYIDSANANTGLATPSGWTEHSDTGSATFAARVTLGSKKINTSASGNISVTGANAAWTMRIFELLPHVLTAGTGTYTLTGNAANLLASRKITATQQSYTLTGNAATLTKSSNLNIAADTGLFALTGQDATLKASRLLNATQQSYTLIGQAASLIASRKITADTATYTLTGKDATLKAARLLSATVQTYSLTGQSVGLRYNRYLAAVVGSFILTGKDATLTYTPIGGYTLTTTTGTFTLTGNDAGLYVSRLLVASPQTYTLTGFDAALKAGRKLAAGVGSFVVTGYDVGLTAARRLSAGLGSFIATFFDVALNYASVSLGMAFLVEFMPYQAHVTETTTGARIEENKIKNMRHTAEAVQSTKIDEITVSNVMLFEEVQDA